MPASGRPPGRGNPSAHPVQRPAPHIPAAPAAGTGFSSFPAGCCPAGSWHRPAAFAAYCGQSRASGSWRQTGCIPYPDLLPWGQRSRCRCSQRQRASRQGRSCPSCLARRGCWRPVRQPYTARCPGWSQHLPVRCARPRSGRSAAAARHRPAGSTGRRFAASAHPLRSSAGSARPACSGAPSGAGGFQCRPAGCRCPRSCWCSPAGQGRSTPARTAARTPQGRPPSAGPAA